MITPIDYVEKGYSIIPIPRGQKAPVIKNWPALRITKETIGQYFKEEDSNVGVLLGAVSDNLIDIDLDASEAVKAAELFFPSTCSFGRMSKERSHLLYRCKIDTRKYQHNGMLLELRGSGQTVFPPSIHPSGEQIMFTAGCPKIQPIDKDSLLFAAGRTASVAMLAKIWRTIEGQRHEAVLALAGALLNSGWDVGKVEFFIRAVCEISGDDEIEDRIRAVMDTSKQDKRTGWPRLAELLGDEVVRKLRDWLEVKDTLEIITESVQTSGDEWPEPLPITTDLPSIPYPIDALPDPIREAVTEVHEFVKAPLPLIASSALGAVSLALQSRIDICRDTRLTGPTSLYLLSVAESGERKTTADSFFTSEIRLFEREREEAAKPDIQKYQAELGAYEAKKRGIQEKIRSLAKQEKSTYAEEKRLEALEKTRPEPPRVPRLILADETPESLAHGLAKRWPSTGVVSSEAGCIFGGHSMRADSIMRNLGLLNTLWDGGSLPIGRKTTESFTVRDARLTLSLQIQEETLKRFFEDSGGLARGIGFLARFLIAWPESTQGCRMYSPAPEDWPKLSAFNTRISQILNAPLTLNEHGGLNPVMLDFTPGAKQAWIEFHDSLEAELKDGGELFEVRDIASKVADNAARLAALFSSFSNFSFSNAEKTTQNNTDFSNFSSFSFSNLVEECFFNSSSRVVLWHLHEAKRFFSGLAVPPELADATKLDSWLIQQYNDKNQSIFGKSHVMQHGKVRKKDRLDAALKELLEMGRIRIFKEQSRTMLELNPMLLK